MSPPGDLEAPISVLNVETSIGLFAEIVSVSRSSKNLSPLYDGYLGVGISCLKPVRGDLLLVTLACGSSKSGYSCILSKVSLLLSQILCFNALGLSNPTFCKTCETRLIGSVIPKASPLSGMS